MFTLIEDRGLNVFKYTQFREYVGDLERSPYPHMDDLLWRESSYVFALEKHLTLVTGIIPGDQVKKRGFACAIGPYDAMDMPIEYLQVHPGHGHKPTKNG